MTRWGWLLGLLVLSGPVLAADDDDDDAVEKVTGGKGKALPIAPTKLPDVRQPPKNVKGKYEITTMAQASNLPYPIVAYRGANETNLDPGFVHGVRQGLEIIYGGDYEGAKTYFMDLESKWPGTAVAPAISTVLWQARMLENFDYRYEKQYYVDNEIAKAQIEKAISVKGNESWDWFLKAGMDGIEAIHVMRRGQYLKALQLAFEAVDCVGKVREAAPDFTDLLLADGMYNYWRTVVTQNSALLPDYGDHRAEGLAQMRDVHRTGIFLGAPAGLSLVFAWTEEGDLREALTYGLSNKKDYPKNLINNLALGTTYVQLRMYPEALERLDQVVAVDPNNRRVWYWHGLAQLRSGNPTAAKADFEKYLGYDSLEPYQKSHGLWRLGQAQQRLKDKAGAEASYAAAVKIDGNEGAKASLAKLKDKKKDDKKKDGKPKEKPVTVQNPEPEK